jgi:hypothetical protein
MVDPKQALRNLKDRFTKIQKPDLTSIERQKRAVAEAQREAERLKIERKS